MIHPRRRTSIAASAVAILLSACGGGGGGSNSSDSPPGPVGGNPPPPAARNNPPELVKPIYQTVQLAMIGFPLDYDVTENGTVFRDPDGDPLSYEVSLSPSGSQCELTVEGTHVRGLPTTAGQCNVQIYARDGRGGELGIGTQVNQALNQPPAVPKPNHNMVVAAGAAIDYDATQGGTTFSDPERHPLTYEVFILEAPSNFSVQGTRIVGSLAGPGHAKVKIVASDAFGGTTEDSFAFVIPAAIHSRPTLPASPYAYADAQLPLPENMQPLPDGRLDVDDTASNYFAVTNAGATLGRVLFHDKRLSITNTHACSTCHSQSHNFASAEVFPRGCVGVRTRRTPMPLTNVRFNNNNRFFADSRGGGLEVSMLMPIQDRDELGSSSLPDLERKLASTDYYPPLFLAAFGNTDVTSERIANALAQFLRSLISYRAKWDRAYYAIPPGPRPDPTTVFTAQEQRGREVYQEGQCSWCHQAGKFHSPWPENNGLDAATAVTEPGAKLFRVASLRNIAVSAPYMHDGRFATLRDVIDHYSTDIQSNPSLGVVLKDNQTGHPRTFHFTETDKIALEAFLNTLTDTDFLSDPKFSDPF